MRSLYLILVAAGAFSSCRSSQALTDYSDPMLGTYKVIAYDVPTYGDVRATFRLQKANGIYTADIRNDLNMVDVHKTEVTGSRIYIEAKAANQEIYFDLTVKGDSVTGWLSDMYRVAGSKRHK
jgi:hypothetical protein